MFYSLALVEYSPIFLLALPSRISLVNICTPSPPLPPTPGLIANEAHGTSPTKTQEHTCDRAHLRCRQKQLLTIPNTFFAFTNTHTPTHPHWGPLNLDMHTLGRPTHTAAKFCAHDPERRALLAAIYFGTQRQRRQTFAHPFPSHYEQIRLYLPCRAKVRASVECVNKCVCVGLCVK